MWVVTEALPKYQTFSSLYVFNTTYLIFWKLCSNNLARRLYCVMTKYECICICIIIKTFPWGSRLYATLSSLIKISKHIVLSAVLTMIDGLVFQLTLLLKYYLIQRFSESWSPASNIAIFFVQIVHVYGLQVLSTFIPPANLGQPTGLCPFGRPR